MEPPVRLAVVGCGRMGRFHLDALTGVEAVDIVAVVDSRPAVAQAAAAAGRTDAYDSVDALVASARAEAWLLATPTPTHPALVERALASDIHVLCEKPLSLEFQDHDRLGAQAEAAGLVLQVGFWRRFSPPWVAAKRIIDTGVIGRPLMLRLAQWDAYPPPPEFCDPAVSGGLAIDCGVHEYDLAEWLSDGRVAAVNAINLPVVDSAIGASGDIDNLVAVLTFDNGAVATVDLTRNARYGDDVRTDVLGSDGALFIELLPTARTRLATADGVHTVPGSKAEDGTLAGVVAQAYAFSQRVRGVTVDVPDAMAGGRAVEIGRAVQTAAQSGEPVDV